MSLFGTLYAAKVARGISWPGSDQLAHQAVCTLAVIAQRTPPSQMAMVAALRLIRALVAPCEPAVLRAIADLRIVAWVGQLAAPHCRALRPLMAMRRSAGCRIAEIGPQGTPDDGVCAV